MDGVLVVKKAQIVVKKTFSGDAEAVKQVKDNGFGLTVTYQEDGSTEPVQDYALSLKPKSSAPERSTGYTSYDANTDTYTWLLDGRQGRTYTVKENNYAASTGYYGAMTYRVVNSENATNGWQTYDEDSGATVSPESYAVDLPESAYQTIIFNNLYTRAGMLNMWKVDPATRDGIAGVTFNLKDTDGNAPTLYHKPSTNEYSTDASSAEQEGFTEKVSSIVTGASGRFGVKLATNPDTGNATYYLEESLPLGYDGVKKIKLTVDANGNVNEAYAQDDISNPSLRLQND